MKTFGLIGHRLGHSFSRKFFTGKFEQENLTEHEYVNFELDSIDLFPGIFESNDHIAGLNCTIPYKQQIMQYLDEIDAEAAEVGAVNTVKVIRNGEKLHLKGFNTDIYGFEHSLKPMLSDKHRKALILGTGGASKAVSHIFRKMGIDYLFATTKDALAENEIHYSEINRQTISDRLVIINTTPLGMYPKTDFFPDIPYQFITPEHILYDLIYNPEETQFMAKGKAQGAAVKNGLEMLHLQALRAWEIWNS